MPTNTTGIGPTPADLRAVCEDPQSVCEDGVCKCAYDYIPLQNYSCGESVTLN